MGIVLAACSDGDDERIRAPLAFLLARDHDSGLSAVGGGPAVATYSQPMALYTVGLRDVAGGNMLSAAYPVGWRYLIGGQHRDDDPIAVADTSHAAPGAPAEFHTLTRGRLAGRLNDAALLAYRLYGGRPDDFEARVLDIPAMYRTALWLHGPREVFFPVLDARRLEAEPIAEDEAYEVRLQAEARQRIGEPEAERALAR